MIKLFLLFLFYLCSVSAQIHIKEITLKCSGEARCKKIIDNKNLKRTFESISHLENVMSSVASIDGIESFIYKLNNNVLSLNIKFSKKIKSIVYKYSSDDLDLEFNIPIEVEDYYDEKKLEISKDNILETLSSLGYSKAKVSSSFSRGEVLFDISPGKPIRISDVYVESESTFVSDYVKKMFYSFKGELYNKQLVREELGSLVRLLEQYGYYLADVNFDEKVLDLRAQLFIKIKNTGLYVISPDIHVSNINQKKIFKDLVISQRRDPSTDSLSSALKTELIHMGYLNPVVDCTGKSYVNIGSDKVKHFHCNIISNERVRIEKIEFQGVSGKREKELQGFFYENSTSVISGGFLDERYVYSYVDFVKKYYYEKGYVNVLLTKPIIRVKKNKAYINYKIREGLVASIDNLVVKGVGPEVKFRILKKIKLKKGDPFNPLVFQQALDNIETHLDSIGYINARVSNLNSPTLIRYKNSNSQVDIKIEIDGYKKYRMGELLILGKKDTRNKLVEREFGIKKDETLSSVKLDQARSRLLSLGIFSRVTIKKIYRPDHLVDIAVIAKEKDFGTLELAPGVRTDLGARLAFDLSYNNLDGMNKRVSLKGSVNQRFDLNSLDEVRRVESNSLVEYDLAVNYFENHIFDSQFNFTTSISTQRRRFFSFDADIDSINYTLSRQFTDIFSASLTQQLEIISQFDATDEIYEGHFQIGSLTPGVRFDLRDNAIIPRSGAWFDLSCEFANPNFLSQDNDELTINYYKLVSRNKFYIPFKNGVFAISMAMGVQENIADESSENSYIPNIKVFRLSGNDVVRGFEDDEINKIPGQKDISEIQVSDKAYMGVVKIEPRFFLSDTTMLGIFYDAGRVSVDPIDVANFRSSAGISFKYLTPVGSINFDYGIKLLRKKLSSGKFESPGRLHVSIGFF